MFLAVLITGGYTKEGWLKSAEIYLPESNSGCSLPELPSKSSSHTQDGNLACGGALDTSKKCFKWTDGSWTQSHSLIGSRYGHVSWATASGVYLMGGWNTESEMTSELVKEDGSVEEGFGLKYKTE